MAARRHRNRPFEPGLVNLDIAARGSNHLVAVDQKRFRGVRADRDLARDRDDGAVEYATGDFDAVRVLLVETTSAAQVEQSRLKAPLFLRQCAAAGGKLKIMDAQLIDGGGSLIEKFSNRRRRR